MKNNDTFFNELQEIIEKNDTVGIMAALDLVIPLAVNNKSCAPLYLHRACIKIQLSDYFSALKDLNTALKLDFNNSEIHILRDNLIILLENLECKSI